MRMLRLLCATSLALVGSDLRGDPVGLGLVQRNVDDGTVVQSDLNP